MVGGKSGFNSHAFSFFFSFFFFYCLPSSQDPLSKVENRLVFAVTESYLVVEFEAV